MERPALKKLMADVKAGKIDTVVVYKIDRLSRSLMDFAEIIGTFEKHDVTFVSVTQQFNTTTSMGRLTLNILLSFAQFEREIIGERIRDKIAMQKKRGLQTGGMPVLGYDLVDGRLVINKKEAELVRHIFERFVDLGSTTLLGKELRDAGVTSKTWTTKKGKVQGGHSINKGHIYRLLNNRKYLGEVTHGELVYPGQHEAIIDRTLWDRVQKLLDTNGRERASATRVSSDAMLKGIIRCGHCGSAMTPGWTRKGSKKYRYYVCVKTNKESKEACPVRRIAAGKVEEAVLEQLRAIILQPEIVAHTARAEPLEGFGLKEKDVGRYLQDLDAVWEHLFPAEQTRLMQLLVKTAQVQPDGVDVELQTSGMGTLVSQLAQAS